MPQQPREVNTAYRRRWRSDPFNYTWERKLRAETDRQRQERIRKQLCPKQHDPPEWRINNRGQRVCAICHREQNRAWWANKRRNGERSGEEMG